MSSYISDSDIWAMFEALQPTVSTSGTKWIVKLNINDGILEGIGNTLMEALYNFYEAIFTTPADGGDSTNG